MANQEMLKQLSETLGATATVESVFGEPIREPGRTVVPVARVAYGFGGGFGSGQGPRRHADQADGGADWGHGEGGGGGGGVRAYPAGALEITEEGTRFIPFPNVRGLALAFGAGLALGAWWFSRRGRS